MGQDIQAMCYHPPKDVLVLGVGEQEPFTLPEDEHHHEWLEESEFFPPSLQAVSNMSYADITFKPMVEHGMIKVLDAQTMNIIDT